MFCRLLLAVVLLRRLTLLFGKAFDCVSHAVLLHKLNSYFRVQGSLLSWLTDYLTDRTHFSVLNGQHSTVLNVTCGIPQGSVLGPSLFALYTNNLLVVTHPVILFVAAKWPQLTKPVKVVRTKENKLSNR